METARETFVKEMTNYLIGVRNNFGEDEFKSAINSEFDDDFIEEYAEFIYDEKITLTSKVLFDDIKHDGTLNNIEYNFQSVMSDFLYYTFPE